MGDLLFWAGLALGVLFGIFGLISLVGWLLPRAHRVAGSVRLNQPPETVWQIISDFPNQEQWYQMVEKVERLEDDRGELWRETYSGNYPLLFRTTESVPPRRLVRTMADEKGPFRGRWEFDLVPVDGGCRITITEFGEVANPFFRFMAKLFMNPALYMELYLRALAQKFGEAAAIEK